MDILILMSRGVVVKKILILSILIFAVVFGISAEGNPTIAIMDVVATNTSEVKSQVIYEYIVDVVNRANRFTLVERSALQAALKEMEISSSGMVDDSTAAAIGKLAGAKYILIANLIIDDGITYLSARIVAVETGQVSDTAMLQKEDDEYIASLANRTISQLLGEPEKKQETVEKKVVEVVEEKENENTETVEKKEAPELKKETATTADNSKLSITVGIAGVLPVLDDAEIFDIGYGLVTDFDYKVMSFGKSSLYAGLGTGVFMDKASLEKGVIFPYNMLGIPLSLNLKYRMNLNKLYFGAKIGGGGMINMFMYTETSPVEEMTVLATSFAASAGLSVGYKLSEKIGLSLFCDGAMTLFKDLPYTALNAGLAVDLNL